MTLCVSWDKLRDSTTDDSVILDKRNVDRLQRNVTEDVRLKEDCICVNH